MESNYFLLLEKIDAFIRKYYKSLIIRGALLFLAIFLAFFLITTLTTYFTYPGVLSRTLIFYTGILLFISLFWQLIGKYLLSYFSFGKRLDRETASRMVGEHFPEIKDKLLNALQLHAISIQSAPGNDLVKASLDQKIRVLHPFSFSNAVDLKKNLSYIRFVFIPLSVIILILLFSPVILKEGSFRMLHHDRVYLRPAPFSFRIMNPSLNVMQNSNFVLDVKIEGSELPSDVSIIESGHSNRLQQISKNHFRYEFNDLQKSMAFRLYGSGVSSEPLELKVLPKPELASFSIDLRFPSYIKRKPEQIRNTGDLLVPEGTKATWIFHTQNASVLNFSFDHLNDKLKVAEPGAVAISKLLTRSSRYSMSPANSYSQKSDSLSYSIQVIADQSPEIRAEQIPDSTGLKRMVFNGAIRDDYGFTSLYFVYGKSELPGDLPKTIKKIKLTIDPEIPVQKFFYSWEYGAAGISPGQHISCYFEIADNDGIHGPKSVKSGLFSLEIPSIQKIDSQVVNDQASLMKKMQAASSKATEIKDAAKTLSEKLANQSDFTFEDRKAAEQIVQDQKNLEKTVGDLQKQQKKNNSESDISEKNQELTDKVKDVEKLFDNILDPKTKELLSNLQRLIDEKNKNRARETLNNLQNSSKDLESELDRMKELYKQLAFEQNVQKEIDKLNSLSQEQKKLADETKNQNNSQNRDQKQKAAKDEQQKQKALKDQYDAIKKNLSDLEKDKPGNSSFSNPDSQEKSIDNDLDKALDKLSQSKSQEASSSQKGASDKMKDMAEDLNKMQDQNAMEQMSVDLKSIRLILENLLRVSFAQEDLMKHFRQIAPNDPSYNALVKKQYDLRDDLSLIRDSIFSLSKRVPQIEAFVNRELNAIHINLDNTITMLGDRRTYEAAGRQQYVMTSVNNLAVMLSNTEEQMAKAMNKAKNGGKGQGNKPSFSQLSKMQSSLNQDMQQSGQNPRDGKGGMSEQLARMAARQQAIREALQRLGKEQGSGTNPSLQQALKAMEESETDLLNKRLNPALQNRQKEIMTRMLEASKAEKQQEEDKQREAKQGKDFSPARIAELKEYQQQKQQASDFIKTVNPDLNSFYKLKINSYFDKLNEGN